MKLSKKDRILIATFSPWKEGKRLPINGNLEPMIDFFLPKVGKIVLIDQIYPGSDFLLPKVEEYTNGKKTEDKNLSFLFKILIPFLKNADKDTTQPIFKLRDFLSVLNTAFWYKKKFNIFIGFESINALAGILLKKLGKVDYVVYYVSDYSPLRYKNKYFNSLYLWLDRFAAQKSDVIWDVSKAMHPARIKAGLDPDTSARVLNVPNALYPSQIKANPVDSIEKNSLVFLGTLGKENGPDLAIKATALIAKKIKQVRLHIVGSGREAELLRLAKKLKVQNKIVFHGFISDREEVSKTIRNYMIGLAPYVYEKGGARLYGDATKIRAYAASGLPVITTHVPPLGKDIQEAGGGLIVKDNPEEISKAAINILSNRMLYSKLRKNIIDFAKNNTWENVYSDAFKKM